MGVRIISWRAEFGGICVAKTMAAAPVAGSCRGNIDDMTALFCNQGQAAARAGDENRFPWQITVLWYPHFLSPLKKSTLFKNVLSLDERAPVSRWPIGHR
jgi:hypothetical protein